LQVCSIWSAVLYVEAPTPIMTSTCLGSIVASALIIVLALTCKNVSLKHISCYSAGRVDSTYSASFATIVDTCAPTGIETIQWPHKGAAVVALLLHPELQILESGTWHPAEVERLCHRCRLEAPLRAQIYHWSYHPPYTWQHTRKSDRADRKVSENRGPWIRYQGYFDAAVSRWGWCRWCTGEKVCTSVALITLAAGWLWSF